MYIDPRKTITAPYSQANGLVFGQSSGCAVMCCNEFYNKNQGISSANHLVPIMNIGNQLYSSFVSVNQTIIFNADRITHTFKCVQDWLWISIQWELHCQQTKINTSRIIHDRQWRNCVTTVTIAIWQSSKYNWLQMCDIESPSSRSYASCYFLHLITKALCSLRTLHRIILLIGWVDKPVLVLRHLFFH